MEPLSAFRAWPTIEGMADDYHETPALAFMKDALRLLDELLA
jgi:hypothetical protein